MIYDNTSSVSYTTHDVYVVYIALTKVKFLTLQLHKMMMMMIMITLGL